MLYPTELQARAAIITTCGAGGKSDRTGFPRRKLTAEQTAKISVARRPSASGLPHLAELPLKLALRRSALENQRHAATVADRRVLAQRGRESA